MKAARSYHRTGAASVYRYLDTSAENGYPVLGIHISVYHCPNRLVTGIYVTGNTESLHTVHLRRDGNDTIPTEAEDGSYLHLPIPL